MNQQPRSSIKLLYSLVFSSLLLIPSSAAAEILGLAGWSGNDDDDHYGYVGAIIPWLTPDLSSRADLGSEGWRIRLWADYLTFEYEGTLAGGAAGIPTTFEGDGPGVEAALGYEWHFLQSGKSTTYVGVRYRHIDVDPDDPSTDVDNDNVGVKLQQEFYYMISPSFDVSLMGSYVVGFNSEYWARLRPGFILDNGWKIGPEISSIGGDVYDKQRYGAFLSGIQLGNIGISFSVGLEDEASTNDDALYGGLSLSTTF